MRRLGELCRQAGLRVPRGKGKLRVLGLAHDSRMVQRGDVFAMLPSASNKWVDATAHLRQAKARGAVALLSEPKVDSQDLPQICSADLWAAYAHLAAAFFGQPSRQLRLVGITGTNGKTTVGFLTRGIVQTHGLPCALLGTVGYWVGGKKYAAPNTTPGALDLQRYLAKSVGAGEKAAVMEVSSHALEQRRVEGCLFDAAVFTNLTRDHLDYHGDMVSYARAKRLLFAMLKPKGVAVVNADDAKGVWMAAARPQGSRRLTYSARGRRADLRAESPRYGPQGTRFRLCGPWGSVELELPLPGAYNVANALASAGAALAVGATLESVVAGLTQPLIPPGRYQLVRAGQPFSVAVDYAHTPDALERVLKAARKVSPGRVLLVFGCGGDRDRGKRPKMGALAARLADVTLLTSDNPRGEDPEAILDDIVAGVPKPKPGALRHVLRVSDRRAAIRRAVALAKPGDTVLLAGKGHEVTQIIGSTRRHFDDAQEARAALRSRGFTQSARVSV